MDADSGARTEAKARRERTDELSARPPRQRRHARVGRQPTVAMLEDSSFFVFAARTTRR
jgi:hypothetical protein